MAGTEWMDVVGLGGINWHRRAAGAALDSSGTSHGEVQRVIDTDPANRAIPHALLAWAIRELDNPFHNPFSKSRLHLELPYTPLKATRLGINVLRVGA